MECVILYRNPWNKKVGFVSDGDSDEIQVYANNEAAERDAPNIPILRAAPYQIVSLDEI